jgi:hypothetical protein
MFKASRLSSFVTVSSFLFVVQLAVQMAVASSLLGFALPFVVVVCARSGGDFPSLSGAALHGWSLKVAATMRDLFVEMIFARIQTGF